MRKYSDNPEDAGHAHRDGHLDVQMQTHMRLFRAQRNFYISGFALFLCLYVRYWSNLQQKITVFSKIIKPLSDIFYLTRILYL